MIPAVSFRVWWTQIRQGEEPALIQLLERFQHRLLALAHTQLEAWLRERADPEGIVQSALASFVRRAHGGEFADLGDWDELWGLLTVITVRKCLNRQRHLLAGCRDARRDVSLDTGAAPLQLELLNREPTAEEGVLLAELTERLLTRFELPERMIVQLLLQGYNAEEIHQRTGRAARTVRRLRARVCQQLEQWRNELI